MFSGTEQSPSAIAAFAVHKPLTADSDGFFFNSNCPIYKYKAVSFKNLFYFNYLVHLVHGSVQKPSAASAASFGEVCGRTSLQKAAGRLWQTGCQGHGVVTSALPGPGRATAPVGRGAASGCPGGTGEAQSSSAATGVTVSAGQHRECLFTFAEVLNLSWPLGLGKKERDPDSPW